MLVDYVQQTRRLLHTADFTITLYPVQVHRSRHPLTANEMHTADISTNSPITLRPIGHDSWVPDSSHAQLYLRSALCIQWQKQVPGTPYTVVICIIDTLGIAAFTDNRQAVGLENIYPYAYYSGVHVCYVYP